MGEFAEGSTLIRVPVSVRDKLASLRRKTNPQWTWSPLETLGQVVKRLATVDPKKAIVAKPLKLPKVKARRGRKVNNKARRGRRHR